MNVIKSYAVLYSPLCRNRPINLSDPTQTSALWDKAPFSLEVDRHFRRAYGLHHQHPDDGGRTLL